MPAAAEVSTAPLLALLPPVLALGLALATGRIIPALAIATATGALLVLGPLGAVTTGARRYLLDSALEESHLYITGFTLCLMATSQLAVQSGGTRGLVSAVRGRLQSARAVRTGTWIAGLLVFFDDYANCMLVGPSMRPLADAWRVSREKLAYLVDCTAAPVAGVVVVSTWVGYEIGLLGDVARELGLEQGGFGLLVGALAMRFYCWWTLLFVGLVAWSGRDFGPMRAAEREAALGERWGTAARGLDPNAEIFEATPSHWVHAVAPIALVLAATVTGLAVDGGMPTLIADDPTALLSPSSWRAVLGAAENNARVLCVAAALGAALAFALPIATRALGPRVALGALGRGGRIGLGALALLLLAWALAGVCRDLGTARVLIGLVGDGVAPALLPALIFCLAAAVALATGTSWGTMALLLPTVLPLAHEAGSALTFSLAVAAVLDGAIFGDHCSPISDTTVMSSIAAGCDHGAHVRTQLPYAVTVMLLALCVGYAAVALGLPLALAHGLGAALVAGAVWGLGRAPATGPS